MTSKNSTIFGVLVTMFLVIAACDSHPGPDSISSHVPQQPGALPGCGLCHSLALGSRRAVLGTNGDFAGNAGISSHHVAGANDPTDAQCLICHNIDQHGSGTVRLNNADTGAVIAYTSRANLETFCLSCHDAFGANGNMSPFSDGSTLGTVPYKASVEISTHWNKTYGHKQKGLTCIGNGNPNTGCHLNGHGSPHVGILARNLTLPQPDGSCYSSLNNEQDYELCFLCHASYPNVAKEVVLGMQQGGNYDSESYCGVASGAYNIPNIMTKFRDVCTGFGTHFYDECWFSGGHEQLHTYHVQITPAWLYRDSIDSGIVCITCHNVHGSNTQYGMLYDELQYNHYDGVGLDKYGTMDAPDYSILGNYPINCTFNCHGIVGKSYNWYEPADE